MTNHEEACDKTSHSPRVQKMPWHSIGGEDPDANDWPDLIMEVASEIGWGEFFLVFQSRFTPPGHSSICLRHP
jgi:hypothetical protein